MRRAAAVVALAMLGSLLACSAPEPPPVDVLANLLEQAERTRNVDDVGRAREQFERDAATASPQHTGRLAALAQLIDETSPIESLRIRLLLAARGVDLGPAATAAARSLAGLGLLPAARSVLTASGAGSADTERASLQEQIDARLDQRARLAQRLGLPVDSPRRQRLLGILTASLYDDPAPGVWGDVDEATTRDEEEAGEVDDVAMACPLRQFTAAAMIGQESAAARRYADGSATFDTTRRPLLDDGQPRPFGVIRFTSAGTLPLRPQALCAAGTAPEPALARALADAGQPASVGQTVCLGRSVAAVVQQDDLPFVLLLLPSAGGAELVATSPLDAPMLRPLRGPRGQPWLLLSTLGGARGYLSSVVVDPARRSQLLSVSMLEFGRVDAIAVRRPEVDELWFNFAVARGRDNCGQCPRFRKVVAVAPHLDGLHVAGELCSAQEVPSPTTGFMAANAQAWVLSKDDDSGFGIGDYSAFVQRQQREGVVPLEIAKALIGNLLEVSENLVKAGDFVGAERRAAAAERALALMPTFEPPLLDAAARAATPTARMEAAYYQGDIARAIEIGERAIAEPYSTANPRIRLDFANRLSALHLAQQSYRAAFPYLEMAQALDTEGYAAVPGNFAWYANQAGDGPRAARFAGRAMQAATEKEGRLGINAVHMALARARSGQADEALDWLQFAINTAAIRGDMPDQALALSTAARMAGAAGEPVLGLALLEQAMVFMDPVVWASEGPEILLDRARLLVRLGRVADADRVAAMSEALSAKRPTNARVEALLLRSRLAAARGADAEALALARSSFDTAIALATGWQGDAYQLASAESSRHAAEWHMARQLAAAAPADALLADLARWKAHVLRDGLERRRLGSAAAGAADAAAQVAGLPGLLRPDEVFVDYFVADDVAFAVVVHGGRSRAVPLGARAPGLRALLGTVQAEMDVRDAGVRERLVRHRTSEPLARALRDLHAALVEPLALPTSSRVMLVSPDSAIGAVPWAALVDAAGQPLGAALATVSVPGALFVREPAARCAGAPACPPRTLAGGLGRTAATQATADDGRPVTLAPLRHARKELERIGALWGSAWVELSDRQPPAKPGPLAIAWLAEQAPRMRLLHVVGHGSFDPIDPVNSRLYLEPAPSEGAPAYVTASQLSALDLEGLPLVVLGACETGALRSTGGGEPLGLVRTFLAGGVQRVVASQWLVDDRATLDMMSRFHAKLATAGTVSAFHAAQRETAQEYPHPYFWAAFQLHGRPDR